MTIVRRLVGAAALAALAGLGSGAAGAACFENGVGCTDSEIIPYRALRHLSCDALWTVRNTIYYENGYCFRSARGRQAFGNGDCAYDDAGMVPLNTYERENIARITRVERERGCR